MTKDFDKHRAQALVFVREAHGQLKDRSDGPVWHHLERVSRLLEHVLMETGEGTDEERETIAIAALGHDCLEDTPVTRERVLDIFGADGLTLIEGMTNRWGDDHPAPYVEAVAAASEGTRIIKLSDLYDNCTSVVFTLTRLGTKWNETYFLPIVRPMIEALMPTKFTTYPKTAERLKTMVRASFASLLEAQERSK